MLGRGHRDMAEARPGKLVYWLGGALVLLLLGLGGYILVANRTHFVPNPDLLKELASATFVEEKPVQGDRGWPQWRGPKRDGVGHEPDLLLEWPAKGPPTVWRSPAGQGYSSFAVRDGLSYSLLTVEGGQEAVVCWRADGKEAWRHTYRPAANYDYGGPRATPTLAGAAVYTVSSDGVLMRLRAVTGEVSWEVNLRERFGARSPQWGYACSPLVDEELVFVSAGGGSAQACMAALHKEDGSTAWSALDDPSGYSSPMPATLGGVRQVVFFTGKRVVGLERASGELLWEFPFADRFGVNAATPLLFEAVVGDEERPAQYVFITTGYDKGCALLRIFPPEGEKGGKFRAAPVYTSNELCCHFASPVRYQDHVYALDEKRDLTCLDLRTGQVKWRHKGFQKGSLLRVDRHLIVLGEDGRLALVKASPEEYREVARCRPLRDRCWTLPALADGKLYLRNQQEALCLDVTGKK